MQLTPFLMFEGDAEAALTFYTQIFPEAELLHIERNGPDGHGKEGKVGAATISIAGQKLRFFDSPAPHQFTFTPAISLFVDCDDEAQQDRLWSALSEGGKALMPIDNYGFSRRFGWTNDRFGVSWQINLP
jgi:predicted 3-demethylubiquinone-9 3-methyltransferase (glyoxalase superfamily)